MAGRSLGCSPGWQRPTRPGNPSGNGGVAAHSGDKLAAALHRAVAALRRQRVAHALIGAWAVGVWGRPRATLDLDFLVLVEGRALDALAEQMRRDGLSVDAEWRLWNPLLTGIQVRLAIGTMAIDLLTPRDAHDRRALSRSRRKRIGGRFCRVVAPDDLVLQKLKVGRPRDFEDAVTVLERSQAEIDRAYLRRWVRRLGLTAELSYIERLSAAGR